MRNHEFPYLEYELRSGINLSFSQDFVSKSVDCLSGICDSCCLFVVLVFIIAFFLALEKRILKALVLRIAECVRVLKQKIAKSATF